MLCIMGQLTEVIPLDLFLGVTFFEELNVCRRQTKLAGALLPENCHVKSPNAGGQWVIHLPRRDSP